MALPVAGLMLSSQLIGLGADAEKLTVPEPPTFRTTMNWSMLPGDCERAAKRRKAVVSPSCGPAAATTNVTPISTGGVELFGMVSRMRAR